MGLGLVGLSIVAVIWLYFYNNPIGHSRGFLIRRFWNWFPLGMSYAFLYMARYNINVINLVLNKVVTNQVFSKIVFMATLVYALSLVFIGPLVDKFGGKKGILIATIGSGLSNVAMGVCTYLYLKRIVDFDLAVALVFLYTLNMFFQSFGAVSIIKVKAYWFHVRERGMFGAIFGTLISFGVYFGFDWGKAIADASAGQPPAEPGFLARTFATFFGAGQGVDAFWLVFFIPAAILFFWAVLDWFLVFDLPSHVGHEDFDTHDASSGEMHKEFSVFDLLGRFLKSPILLTVAVIEITTGVLRNGTLQWYLPFAKDMAQEGSAFFTGHWGLILCITGIFAGFLGGYVSDHIFQSRRTPPVAIASGIMIFLCLAMTFVMKTSPFAMGALSVLVCFLSISVHSLMSGTAATDFGGRKATATASGITDACVYLGTSLQSYSLGTLLAHYGWVRWPLFMLPFAVIGLIFAGRAWHALPEATKRYLATVENKKSKTVPPESGIVQTH